MLRRLATEQYELMRLDAYFAGAQPLSYLDPRVAEQLQGRLRSLIINWPRLIVSSLEERLDVEGFRVGKEAPPDDSLWEIWQANDLDEWSQMGHTDSLVLKRSFVTVWYGDNEGDPPRIAVESPLQMTVSFVPGTQKVSSAVKVWHDPSAGSSSSPGRFANLYLPDRIERYSGSGPAVGGQPWSGNPWQPRDPWGSTNLDATGAATEWDLIETVSNPLGKVPVVPFPNRPRLTLPLGESELSDVLPIADAVNKLATDMMVTSEYHASPRRYVTGLDIPQGGSPQQDRMRAEIQEYWQKAETGRFLAGGTTKSGAPLSMGEFPAASLDNFVHAIGMLTGQIAAIAGLPPHYLGINTQNPASADAIRSAEASLVKKARRKQRSLGGSWERVMRLALLVRDGKVSDAAHGMETIWRDPETRPVAQETDAAVKLVMANITDPEQALEDLGYTSVQRDRIVLRKKTAADEINKMAMQSKIELAVGLMADQGLSKQAAIKAAGLVADADQHLIDRAAGGVLPSVPAAQAPPATV